MVEACKVKRRYIKYKALIHVDGLIFDMDKLDMLQGMEWSIWDDAERFMRVWRRITR